MEPCVRPSRAPTPPQAQPARPCIVSVRSSRMRKKEKAKAGPTRLGPQARINSVTTNGRHLPKSKAQSPKAKAQSCPCIWSLSQSTAECPAIPPVAATDKSRVPVGGTSARPSGYTGAGRGGFAGVWEPWMGGHKAPWVRALCLRSTASQAPERPAAQRLGWTPEGDSRRPPQTHPAPPNAEQRRAAAPRCRFTRFLLLLLRLLLLLSRGGAGAQPPHCLTPPVRAVRRCPSPGVV